MKGLLLVLMGLVTLASAAQAQSGRHVALGVGLGFHHFTDGDFSQKNPGVSIIYRLAWKPGTRDGWKLEPSATIGWGKTDVRTDIAGVSTHIGKLRTIPILVGAGPSYRHGKTKVGVAVLAGPSFNTFTHDSGASPVAVKNSFAARSEAGLWYDVSSRLGLHTSVAYVYNRPTADPASGATAGSGKWKTDHLNFSVGFAIGLF
jgi:hypothetical protein